MVQGCKNEVKQRERGTLGHSEDRTNTQLYETRSLFDSVVLAYQALKLD